jgi:hypothetical protein
MSAPNPQLSQSQLLAANQIDDVGRAVLTLASEVWVLTDRQMVMEAALADRGIELDLDRYQLSPGLAAKLDAQRKQFIASLIETLTGR